MLNNKGGVNLELPLREQFIFAMMRFKRIDLCPHLMGSLNHSELIVMARVSDGCFCEEKGAAVSDIQQDLFVSKSAVSQTLNNLEKKGYIIRTIDTDDRRKITVTLTPEGKKVLAEAQCGYDESIDQVLEQFGEENVKLFLELVNQLINIFEENQ